MAEGTGNNLPGGGFTGITRSSKTVRVLVWCAAALLALGSFPVIPFIPHFLFIFYPYGLLGPDNLPYVEYFNPLPLLAAVALATI